MSNIAEAQGFFPSGETVAQMGMDYAREFRGVYSEERIGHMLAVGPMQAYVGLAIKNGHLVPAAEVAELREQLATARLRIETLEDHIEHASYEAEERDAP